MPSCCAMEFSRGEKTGGHIWVPGPRALPRCRAPGGLPSCRGPVARFLSLGRCRPQLQGRVCTQPAMILMCESPGRGVRKTLYVFHNSVASRGAVGAQGDLKHIFETAK